MCDFSTVYFTLENQFKYTGSFIVHLTVGANHSQAPKTHFLHIFLLFRQKGQKRFKKIRNCWKREKSLKTTKNIWTALGACNTQKLVQIHNRAPQLQWSNMWRKNSSRQKLSVSTPSLVKTSAGEKMVHRGSHSS